MEIKSQKGGKGGNERKRADEEEGRGWQDERKGGGRIKRRIRIRGRGKEEGRGRGEGGRGAHIDVLDGLEHEVRVMELLLKGALASRRRMGRHGRRRDGE